MKNEVHKGLENLSEIILLKAATWNTSRGSFIPKHTINKYAILPPEIDGLFLAEIYICQNFQVRLLLRT